MFWVVEDGQTSWRICWRASICVNERVLVLVSVRMCWSACACVSTCLRFHAGVAVRTCKRLYVCMRVWHCVGACVCMLVRMRACMRRPVCVCRQDCPHDTG